MYYHDKNYYIMCYHMARLTTCTTKERCIYWIYINLKGKGTV